MFPTTLHFFFVLVPVFHRDSQCNLQVQATLDDKLSCIPQIIWNQDKLFNYRTKNCFISENFLMLTSLFCLAI